MRVIGPDSEQMGILSRDEALRAAEEFGLDLVEIQPNGDPPVCRIMDYGKFKFEAQKKAAQAENLRLVADVVRGVHQTPACARFRSGGSASAASERAASDRRTISWFGEPKRRRASLPSSASLAPTTAITGTFCSECSRIL